MQRPQRTLQQNHKSNHRGETLIRKWQFNARTTSNPSSSPIDGRDVAVKRRTRMNGDIGLVKVGQNETMNHARNQNILRRVNLIQMMTYCQPRPQYMLDMKKTRDTLIKRNYLLKVGVYCLLGQKQWPHSTTNWNTWTEKNLHMLQQTATVLAFSAALGIEIDIPNASIRKEPFESKLTIKLDKQVFSK